LLCPAQLFGFGFKSLFGFVDSIYILYYSFAVSFDLFASTALLILSSPLSLLTALAILIESRGKGPVFYFQERTGLNGVPFKVIKFRSMRTDAEADGKARWATKDDPRVTKVGAVIRKYRLDEIPQLWNILRGDMSLVGPRPERPEFVERLTRLNPLYWERHRVKPGLTGWAQLSYPYGSSDEDSMQKLQYDLYYIKNRTLFFDFYILIQTAEVVLFRKGSR
jgi:exopolysaccharide biosynthesis polyprenyl glycosylphosphotransferase